MFQDLSAADIQPLPIDSETPEILLSEEIRNKLQAVLEKEDSFARVYTATSVVKPDNNNVFFSNHWFYLAVLCKKYAQALYPYCMFFDQRIRNDQDMIKDLAAGKVDNASFAALFESEEDKARMIKFIQGDADFRPGKALINLRDGNRIAIRSCKDIFGSCVLKKIAVPDASSGYLGSLIYNLAKYSDVYDALEREVDTLIKKSKEQNPQKDISEKDTSDSIRFNTGLISEFPRNRIIFGAPGTGKSYTLNTQRMELLGFGNETDYERVTFHPDYSYANFVGTYKPVMVDGRADALIDPDTKYVLSILNDSSRTAQEKYDLLYDRFKDEGLTRLPVLLGLYTDESFKTRKQDGSDAANDNSVEKNHGRAIRKYVSLITGNEKTSDIAYEYVPGPFMRVYVNALKNAKTATPRPHLLIIEEINRANVAAVFGDIFQLLDRGDDAVSEYPIQASEDIKKYLAKELGGSPDEYTKIKIPDNMFIWATMNSADQGVFPMDTAFKRRWDFTYLGIDDCDKKIRGKYVYLAEDKSQKVEWNKLRKAINQFLAKEKINEDKQLGPYFISRNIVVPTAGDEINRERFIRVFKNKVIMYLFEDAAKQKRSKLFEGCSQNGTRYSEICKEFDIKGIGIFNHEIQLETEPEESPHTPSEDN